MADRLACVLVWTTTTVVVGALLWIVSSIAIEGAGSISWEFLSGAPRNAGREGGIGPILVSTGAILAVCLGAAVPLALGAAVALSEWGARDARATRLIRWSLDTLAAVPSIVFGLFGSAFFGIALGLGFSIASGGLTLACMILPLLIRTTEQSLRSVPSTYVRDASALGLGRATTLRHILLPAAAPGIAAGLVLGMGRALSETAALLFTSGYVTRMPSSLGDSGRALSVHIYDLAMNVPGGTERAYGTALVLISILLFLNALAVGLLQRWSRGRTRSSAEPILA